LGLIILVFRRLPQALELGNEKQNEAKNALAEKGLPLISVSSLQTFLRLWSKRFWQFILEAKDIRHPAKITYKMKRLFKIPSTGEKSSINQDNATDFEVKTEKYFLEQIKRDPKNLEHYSSLGKHYLTEKNYLEAVNVYEYLVKHEPSESNHSAQLGYIKLNLEDYEAAVKHYEKSVSLDASHPNRYYNLSLSHGAQGQWPNAAEVLRKALELEPNNFKYLKFLSEIYLKMGDKQNYGKINRLLRKTDSITTKTTSENALNRVDVIKPL